MKVCESSGSVEDVKTLFCLSAEGLEAADPLSGGQVARSLIAVT